MIVFFFKLCLKTFPFHRPILLKSFGAYKRQNVKFGKILLHALLTIEIKNLVRDSLDLTISCESYLFPHIIFKNQRYRLNAGVVKVLSRNQFHQKQAMTLILPWKTEPNKRGTGGKIIQKGNIRTGIR